MPTPIDSRGRTGLATGQCRPDSVLSGCVGRGTTRVVESARNSSAADVDPAADEPGADHFAYDDGNGSVHIGDAATGHEVQRITADLSALNVNRMAVTSSLPPLAFR